MSRDILYFIGNHQHTTLTIAKQIQHFLGEYLDVKHWCLQQSDPPFDFNICDIFVTSSYTALEKIKKYIPANKKVIIAARALDTKNLDEVLELPPGTKVLVVANSEETCKVAMDLMERIGINYLQPYPYYPGFNKTLSTDITTAVTTGLGHLVPTNISKIVDLGVKGLDLSSYVEIILAAQLPKELINRISELYLKEIFNLSIRRQSAAELNNKLKRRLEVIINTIDEAMIAINKDQEIILTNLAADNMFGMNTFTTIGQKLNQVLPNINLTPVLNESLSMVHNIQQINHRYYIISANPLMDANGQIEGAVATFKHIDEVQELETKVRRELKKRGHVAKYTFPDIIGQNEKLLNGINLAKKFSQTDLTVLIEAESGTGKELFAHAIHNMSSRKHGPFVAINFAALPDNLVESELFGYEDGAFTGAKKGGKQGLFEEAHKGTILLDEIGDTTLDVQKKLLRVLEEREVRRVGGSTVTPIDVRVIASTNSNLEQLVETGLFRNDLFYRLCTLPLYIPPLRERKEDIILLTNFFSRKLYQRKLELDWPVEEFLSNYRWPGNIRELQNVVKYLCSIVPGNEKATIKHLPAYLARSTSINTDSKFEPYNLQKFDLTKKEFIDLGILEIIIFMLKEIESYSVLNKGLGRNTLAERLQKQTHTTIPDHKLRQWLNLLVKLGFIEAGKTKQGTRISAQGSNFIKYVDSSANINLGNSVSKLN